MKTPKPKVAAPIEKPAPEKIDPPKLDSKFFAVVISQAPNPQWIYVKSLESDMGKLPVIIPRRYTDKLVGKKIQVEAITDGVGTSYRYVPNE